MDEFMTRPEGEHHQYSGLRATAARKRQETVSRLVRGITALRAQGDTVNQFTIKRECGLDATTIRRNPEALAIFEQESDYLRERRRKEKERKSRSNRRRPQQVTHGEQAVRPERAANDPLLSYSKSRLVKLIRHLEQERDDAQRVYDTVLEKYHRIVSDHTECEITIMRLKQKWLHGHEE